MQLHAASVKKKKRGGTILSDTRRRYTSTLLKRVAARLVIFFFFFFVSGRYQLRLLRRSRKVTQSQVGIPGQLEGGGDGGVREPSP